jgi:hypothetical protein
MQKVKRFWKKSKRIVFISDMHCGHVAGLTHPDFNITHTDQNDKSEKQHKTRRIRQSKQRDVLWKWFASRIDAYRPFDRLIHNGDAIDGSGKRSGGTELLCTDRDEQVEMAKAAIEFVSGGKALVDLTYGTGYHTGNEEDWEDVLAREVKANSIQGEIHADVNGLVFACKHKIGGSKSPVSRFTALSNAQLRQELWALRDQQPKANVIVRSHVHRCLYIGEPGTRSFVITTPALQGLGSKYGIRQVDGLPVEFGFVVFDVLDRGRWICQPEIASLELQRCSVTKW